MFGKKKEESVGGDGRNGGADKAQSRSSTKHGESSSAHSSTMAHVRESVSHAAKHMLGLEDMTWEELQAMERRRRAVLKRVELPFYRILMFWDGTALQILLFDPLFWICMALYVLVRFQARYDLPEEVESLTTGDISVLGAFLSFFLVFYVSKTNTRFFDLYNVSMTILGRCLDVAHLSRTSLPLSSGFKIARYMTASNLFTYVGMDDGYTYDNLFVPLNEQCCFLTEEEVKRMQLIGTSGGSCARELLVWAIFEVEKNLEEGVIDAHAAYQFRKYMLDMRACIGVLFDYQDQPVPFFYVHFISLLSFVYLPLFAITTAYAAGSGDNAFWGSDVISGLIVFLQCVFVIGLRVLGQNMSDPFGMDIPDLSVLTYVISTWELAVRVIYADGQPEVSAEQEEAMARKHRSVGEAFEKKRLGREYVEDKRHDEIEIGDDSAL